MLVFKNNNMTSTSKNGKMYIHTNNAHDDYYVSMIVYSWRPPLCFWIISYNCYNFITCMLLQKLLLLQGKIIIIKMSIMMKRN